MQRPQGKTHHIMHPSHCMIGNKFRALWKSSCYMRRREASDMPPSLSLQGVHSIRVQHSHDHGQHSSRQSAGCTGQAPSDAVLMLQQASDQLACICLAYVHMHLQTTPVYMNKQLDLAGVWNRTHFEIKILFHHGCRLGRLDRQAYRWNSRWQPYRGCMKLLTALSQLLSQASE